MPGRNGPSHRGDETQMPPERASDFLDADDSPPDQEGTPAQVPAGHGAGSEADAGGVRQGVLQEPLLRRRPVDQTRTGVFGMTTDLAVTVYTPESPLSHPRQLVRDMF